MRKQKVYLETTMFNYYFDETKNAQPVTVAFFEAIGSGQFEGYTSVYAYEELDKAPEPQRTNMLNLIEKYHITVLDTSDEADQLAENYIASNIIPRKKNTDALHIAIASVNELDMILSFNFKHINKLKTKTQIPAANQVSGYRDIIIAQPEGVIDYEIDD
jgi:predicted nucleic acid-binding protein